MFVKWATGSHCWDYYRGTFSPSSSHCISFEDRPPSCIRGIQRWPTRETVFLKWSPGVGITSGQFKSCICVAEVNTPLQISRTHRIRRTCRDIFLRNIWSKLCVSMSMLAWSYPVQLANDHRYSWYKDWTTITEYFVENWLRYNRSWNLEFRWNWNHNRTWRWRRCCY